MAASLKLAGFVFRRVAVRARQVRPRRSRQERTHRLTWHSSGLAGNGAFQFKIYGRPAAQFYVRLFDVL